MTPSLKANRCEEWNNPKWEVATKTHIRNLPNLFYFIYPRKSAFKMLLKERNEPLNVFVSTPLVWFLFYIRFNNG